MAERFTECLKYVPIISDTHARPLDMVNESVNNNRILSLPPNPNFVGISWEDMTREQTIQKFFYYDAIQPNQYRNIRPDGRWYRVMKKSADSNWKYRMRGGGFLVENNSERGFIVLKNSSYNFTMSFPYDKIYIFRRKSKREISHLRHSDIHCQNFIDRYLTGINRPRRNKLFIAFQSRIDNAPNLYTGSSLTELYNTIPDSTKPRKTTIQNVLSSGVNEAGGFRFGRNTMDRIQEIEDDFDLIEDCNSLIHHGVIRNEISRIWDL